jgi:hypothetical protein
VDFNVPVTRMVDSEISSIDAVVVVAQEPALAGSDGAGTTDERDKDDDDDAAAWCWIGSGCRRCTQRPPRRIAS